MNLTQAACQADQNLKLATEEVELLMHPRMLYDAQVITARQLSKRLRQTADLLERSIE